MNKFLTAALLGASMIAMAAPAEAVVTLTSSSTVGGVKFLNYSGLFEDNGDGTGLVDITQIKPGVGKFVLTFTFTTPVGRLNSSGTSVALAATSDIDFKDVTTTGPTPVTYKAVVLNNVVGSFSNEPGVVGTSMWFWNPGLAVPTAAPNKLQISGESFGANANLRGDVTFLAVPEPATWALMILGFGLVGASARGRRRGVVTA